MTETKAIFSVDEAAALLGWSRRTIIRMFADEPGVIVWAQPEERGKRRYRSLRIPRAVIQRVLSRLSPDGSVVLKFMRRKR